MRLWRPHRAVILLLFVGLLGVTTLAWGQFANHTGNVVGTVGGACNSGLNDYAWPDTNGNILKCVSSVWTLVTQPATAAGSTGYVQFNSSGSLAGSANLFWDNTNNRLGIGTASPSLPLQVGSALTPVLAVTPTEASVYSTLTNTSGILPATAFITQATPASNSNADLYSTYTELSVPSSSSVNYGNLYASRIENIFSGTGTDNQLQGIQLLAENNSVSGTVSNVTGIQIFAWNGLGGTVTTDTGLGIGISNRSTGTIGKILGVNVAASNINASGTVTSAYGGQFAVTNSGTMTSAAGIAIANISQATNNTGLLMGTTTIPSGNFGIYNSSTNPNYFAGSVSIGTTVPVVSLDLSQKTDALALPVGTTGQEPASPLNGMIRYNTTLSDLEAYVAGAWTTLTTGGSLAAITLGTSAATPDPASSFSATTGLFSAASGQVSVTSTGSEVARFSTGAAIGTSYAGTAPPTNGLIVSGNVGIGTSNPGALFTVGNNTFEVNSSGVVTTTNGVTLGDLAQIATNTVLGNATSGTANISALSVGGCSSASSALIWTTNTGFGCNTSITAAASTNVATTASSTSSTFFPLFVASSSNGNQAVDLNANFTINPSTGALGIIGPLTSTQVGIGTTSTNGIVLTNTTAATSTVNQWSPRVHWTGQGWKTTATAGSQAVDVIEELQPVAGAANPSGNLTWSSSINGGAYSPLMILTTGGNVGIGTATPGFNLDVQASSGTATLRLKNTGGGSQIAIDRSSTSSNSQFFFSTAGTEDFAFGTGLGGTGVSDFGIYDASTAADAIAIKQSNGFVGIGTAVPGAALSVNGGEVVGSYGASGTAAPSNGLIVSGSVGIGTATIANKLDVNGAASIGYPDVAAPSNGLIVSGKAGFGTNNPIQQLVVSNGGAEGIELNPAREGANTAAIFAINRSGGSQVDLYLGANSYHFETPIDSSERMTILSGGNVGIGTTTPLVNLHVRVGTNANFLFYSGSQMGTPTGELQFTNDAANANNPIMITASSVNFNAASVGIAQTSPSYLLHVGSSSASGTVAEFQNASGNCTFTPTTSTWSCSSDIRLKKDIADTGEALGGLDDMRIRDFTIKATGERKTGVIAQEMLQAHPDMVHLGKDGFYTVDEPNPWKLVKAIQELKFDNDELRREVAELRREVRAQ